MTRYFWKIGAMLLCLLFTSCPLEMGISDGITIDNTGVCESTAIAVDSLGYSHICYTMDSTLKYATNSSGSWIYTALSAMGSGWSSIGLAIDHNNKLHILYAGKYLTNASGTWVTTSLDESYSFWGEKCSLVIDSFDKIHVCFQDLHYSTQTADLIYATNATGTWAYTPLGAMGENGYYGIGCTMAIDSLNKLHICYIYQTADTAAIIKYATNKSGSWNTTSIESIASPRGTAGFAPSIAVDKADNAHVCYAADWTYFSLKYATNATGAWTSTTIDTNQVGIYNSIATDASNNAHISCYDFHIRQLKYATNTGGSWNKYVVDSYPNVGEHSTIALDANNRPHIAYISFQYPRSDLMYSTW